MHDFISSVLCLSIHTLIFCHTHCAPSWQQDLTKICLVQKLRRNLTNSYKFDLNVMKKGVDTVQTCDMKSY